MKLDFEATYKNGLINNADDVEMLYKKAKGNSTGITFFDGDRAVYIADDFDDKDKIVDIEQKISLTSRVKFLEGVIETLLDKLDSAFSMNAVQGAPLDATWVTKSAEVKQKILDAKQDYLDLEDELQELKDNLK